MNQNLVRICLVSIAAFAAGMLFGYFQVKDELVVLTVNPAERSLMSSM